MPRQTAQQCGSRLAARILILLGAFATSGCSLLFPREAGEELSHFGTQAPRPGQLAPDADLVTLDGRRVRLSDYLGQRPVVLQWGSHTCPVYRYRRFDLRELREEFEDRVKFVTVYTLEAHPTGSKSPYRDEEWVTGINRITGVRLSQTHTLNKRLERARWSARALAKKGPHLVDGPGNHGWKAYGAAPSPAYVIDTNGRIALRQVWMEPEEIRATLERLLSAPPR